MTSSHVGRRPDFCWLRSYHYLSRFRLHVCRDVGSYTKMMSLIIIGCHSARTLLCLVEIDQSLRQSCRSDLDVWTRTYSGITKTDIIPCVPDIWTVRRGSSRNPACLVACSGSAPVAPRCLLATVRVPWIDMGSAKPWLETGDLCTFCDWWASQTETTWFGRTLGPLCTTASSICSSCATCPAHCSSHRLRNVLVSRGAKLCGVGTSRDQSVSQTM